MQAEYRALVDGSGLADRSDQALLEITGKDRASWLHNLTTNQVKTLGRGEGNYAFALNIKGRILFDLNVLIRAESIWIDLDRRFLDLAQTHLSKYTIMEDVTIVNRSDEFIRLGLVGRRAAELLAQLGAPLAAKLPVLNMTEWNREDVTIPLFRHDFCGEFALELFVPAGKAVEVWKQLTDAAVPLPAIPVGEDAVQVRRIESGIPWPGSEITEEYLPAETGQLVRAVSFNKGCYLGQEVVERMRARHVVARQLVGVGMEGDVVPPAGAILVDADDKSVGQVTSVCRSVERGGIIGLGYVKTACSAPGTALRVAWEGGSSAAVVSPLAVVASTT